jgi:hypothetical protein
MTKRKSPPPVGRIPVREFRAHLSLVFTAGEPVIVADRAGNGGGRPRAIVLPVPKFYSWEAAKLRSAIAKLRADFARAIQALDPDEPR